MSEEVVTKDMLTSVANRMHAMLMTKLGQLESHVDSQIKDFDERIGGQFKKLEERVALAGSSQKDPNQDKVSGVVRQTNEVVKEVISLRTDMDELMRTKGQRGNNTTDDLKMQRCVDELESMKRQVAALENLRGQVETMSKDIQALVGSQSEMGEMDVRLRTARHTWMQQTSLTNQPLPSLTNSPPVLTTYEFDRRTGPGLGVELGPGGGNKYLTIRKIFEWGIVGQWNKSNPGRALKEGDKILQINNARDDAGKLLDEITKKEVLRITAEKDDTMSFDI
mmetsp:Transcript_64243/g.114075  ORF Transcript_64243/g.114075 Transcript_64243/m.114075 type:complete len:280 (+) Transcript_64243:40-879(+)